jgi:Cd2+/Zn2+-exporting ATPase
VPLAFFCGIGAGSKRGILFKDGSSMEALAQVKAAALDKTGTLTQGVFQVEEYTEELLALCAACEQHSTHPIANSICAKAKALALPLAAAEEIAEVSGMGIRAVVDGASVLCGNASLLESAGIAVPATEGTRVHIAKDGVYAGSILIADSLKPDAAAAVTELKKQGLTPAILTGDREETAAAVAKETGISRVYARLLPAQKLSTLQTLRKELGGVLFVGDGINDAPVLAGADVGAAMGAGADAAIEAADVVFLHNRAADIPEAVHLAKRTRQIAWQNVVFALGFKLLVMVLGLLGFANLWLAVFADSGVAALCVLNAIRILRSK